MLRTKVSSAKEGGVAAGLRTKVSSAKEGGVAAGWSALDSVYLAYSQDY